MSQRAFEFKLSHEWPHLAARDHQFDKIVGSHYICCAIFLGVSLLITLIGYVQHAISMWELIHRPGVIHLGANPIVSALLTGLSITLLEGVLLMFLLAERRATLRARELHADALAATVAGAEFPIRSGAAEHDTWREVLKTVSQPFVTHPDPVYRASAVAAKNPFLSADKMFFVSQTFVVCLLIDLLLQIIGPSAARRPEFLLWRLQVSPISMIIIYLIASSFYVVSTRLMISAAALSARPNTTIGTSVASAPIFLGCALLGTTFVVGSSQSVWYVLLTEHWQLRRVLAEQWDMLSLLAMNLVSVALILSISGLIGATQERKWLRLLAWLPLITANSLGVVIMMR